MSFPQITCPASHVLPYLSLADQSCLRVVSRASRHLMRQARASDHAGFDPAKALREREQQELESRWTYKLKTRCKLIGKDLLYGLSGAYTAKCLTSRIVEGFLDAGDAYSKHNIIKEVWRLTSGCGVGFGLAIAIVDASLNTRYVNPNVALTMLKTFIPFTALNILEGLNRENPTPEFRLAAIRTAISIVVVAHSVRQEIQDRRNASERTS